jgi:hypothetical protein
VIADFKVHTLPGITCADSVFLRPISVVPFSWYDEAYQTYKMDVAALKKRQSQLYAVYVGGQYERADENLQEEDEWWLDEDEWFWSVYEHPLRDAPKLGDVCGPYGESYLELTY